MRLAGQAKMGYYPCPEAAVEMVGRFLRAPDGPFTILDPCAGEGRALKQLAELLRCDPKRVHAMELDETRAEALKQALPLAKIVAPAAMECCSMMPNALSLAWVNPPFDNGWDGARVEDKFIRHITPWIRPGGVLVLICPENAAKTWDIQNHLKEWYHDIQVVPFPEGARAYNEVAVLAVKHKEKVPSYAVTWEQIQAKSGTVYDLPRAESPRHFAKTQLTDDEWREAFAGSPLAQHYATRNETPSLALPTPPLALGVGHVGLLVAAGQLDGVVASECQAPHVVRGTSRKREVTKIEVNEETGATKTTITELIELVVRTVSAAGVLTTYSDAPPAPPEPDKPKKEVDNDDDE